MPNIAYLLTHAAYHFGLAIWIGGALILGAFVAPRLFRTLPRAQAGAIFGPVLRAFARARLLSFIVVVIAAALMHFVWEGGRGAASIVVRWLALGIMGFAIAYEIGFLERALAERGAQLTEEMGENDERRRAFNRLHRRAENLMKASVVAAVVALLMS